MDMFNIYKQTGQETLHDTGWTPYGTRQPEIHAAQGRKREIAFMQKIRCRKSNVGTDNLGIHGDRKDEKQNHWQGSDRAGPDRRNEAEQHHGLGQRSRDAEQLAGINIGK